MKVKIYYSFIFKYWCVEIPSNIGQPYHFNFLDFEIARQFSALMIKHPTQRATTLFALTQAMLTFSEPRDAIRFS